MVSKAGSLAVAINPPVEYTYSSTWGTGMTGAQVVVIQYWLKLACIFRGLNTRLFFMSSSFNLAITVSAGNRIFFLSNVD